jgi:hypothetical protein
MNTVSRTAIALSCLLALAACNKKPAEEAAPTPAAAPAAAAPETPAEPTDEQRAAARKQAALDFATMEDKFLNDPLAQWAASGKASSSYGEKGEQMPKTPQESRAWKATGKVDGDEWSQLEQDVGMDWLELGYAKPVNATAVRAVFTSAEAVNAITKVELIDEAGASTVVWSGVSDAKPEENGPRTWFVREFPKTEKKVKGVKLTFANPVAVGYKNVDAVQLVGE